METVTAPHCVGFASGAIAAAGQHSSLLCSTADMFSCVQGCCVVYVSEAVAAAGECSELLYNTVKVPFSIHMYLMLVSAQSMHMQLQWRVTDILAPHSDKATLTV